MNGQRLRELLAEVAAGQRSVEDAASALTTLPFEDLGFARLDHHREVRGGFAEVIYGEGKTPEQVLGLVEALLAHGANALVTRVSPAAAELVQSRVEDAEHLELARILRVQRTLPAPLGRVGVVCAGTSDLPVADEAAVCAAFFGAEVVRITDVGVAGLHRILGEVERLRSLDVIIVAAGMDGALPSVVGGLVARPVIAVPTSVGYGASFGGVSALLANLNACAAGVVVVNIDNGFGAARAAARMLTKVASTPSAG